MTPLSARSTLVNLSLEKNLTSNRPKPIGVLTRTKSSCSDDRLPLGYLLPDFQPHRSNFFVRLPLFFSPPGRKGVDTGETVPIGLLCKFPLLEITAYIHATCCWNLSRFEATFFWPTNKDSNEINPSKPIGFVIWVKKLQNEKHIRLRYLISNFEQLLFWALVWPRSKWKWDFFLSVKKFQSSGVPIGLLTKKKFFSHILENIKKNPQTSFERFLMTTSSARSVLVIFLLKKNLTLNGCKPIRVLTHTKLSG